MLEDIGSAREISQRMVRLALGTYIRVLNLPLPVRNSRLLTKLLILDLEAHAPACAIKRIEVEAIPAKPRVVQNGLFVPLSPEPEKLELTLARLKAVVGEENVGSPEILDTHRPDAFSLKKFGLGVGFAQQNGNRTQEAHERTQKAQKEVLGSHFLCLLCSDLCLLCQIIEISIPPIANPKLISDSKPTPSPSCPQRSRFGYCGPHSKPPFSFAAASPHGLDFMACMVPLRPRPDHGTHPAIGGVRTRGIAKNGTSKSPMRSTAFITTCTSTLVRARSLRLSASYIELHASSAFSFLDGACLPEEFAGACAEYDMPAMALLDRDGVYGAPRFHLAAKKAGIQAHIGAEVSSLTGIRYPLLAETCEGYQNLCRLMTRMKLRAAKGKGAITEEELAAHARGLICLTGGECGPLTKTIANDNGDNASVTLERLIAIFGSENVYVELQRHYDRAEEAINQRAVALAETFHLPLLATNGVRYALRHQREILDVFTCIRNHRTLETAGGYFQKLRTASQNARTNAAALSRSAGCHREYHRALAPASIQPDGSRLQIPEISGGRGRNDGVISPQAHGGRRAQPLPSLR
jgi:hypothetical protein